MRADAVALILALVRGYFSWVELILVVITFLYFFSFLFFF